ncbi:unnamed protein product [Peronospora destructor]|uniref:AAA+ ATPase domain-containing protein n=1 Tax=Peronospora destructor TaxID=86335 RepID=A0AAV0TPP9_9STRA|nr:unnamed protein product [Peronospora destructor]
MTSQSFSQGTKTTFKRSCTLTTAYNDGLASRFQEVVFEDFDAQELETVWDGIAQDRGWKYEKAIAKVACRRLAKAAGHKGFGNARAVRKLFEQAVKEAMAREDFDNDLEFQTVDLLGDRPSTNPKLQAVLDEVEDKTGWHKIKEEMKKLVRISDENYERELKGQETVPVCLNRLFLGNPGTGKTTCAGYYGRLLKTLHFLSNGEVVKKTAGDFVGNHVSALGTTKLVETSGLDLTGEYLGQTKAKVTEKLVEAKGGLLFIDEAYELGKGHFGEEAMTTLVAAMTDPSYTGMVIVIAGYPKDMDIMLNRNAGLKSRFKRFIDFPDWEANDGVAFLKAKAQTEGITLDNGTEFVLQKIFLELKRLDGFGNGRDAVRVWEELLQCRAQRVFDLPEEVRTITANDAQMAGEGILAARRPPDGQVLSQSSMPSDNPMFRTRELHPGTLQSLPEEIELQKAKEIPTEDRVEVNEADVENGEVEAEEDPEDWEELERAKKDYAAHLNALKRAREQAKLEEERRRAEAIQEKIRQICPCPAGFNWYKSGSGWRCGGGSHFVSDAQLNRQFTR